MKNTSSIAGRKPLVTLINPPSPCAKLGTGLFSIPPIGLAYIAASLEEAGYAVDIVDGVGEWIDHSATAQVGEHEVNLVGGSLEMVLGRISPDTQLFGLTCMFMHHWPVVRTLMREIRERFPGVPIIAGGEQASGGALYCLKEIEIDAIVKGEGDETVVPLVDTLLNGGSLSEVEGIAYLGADGEVVHTGPRPRVRNIDQLPRPSWHLVPVKEYMRKSLFHGPSNGSSMPIVATRGCPYQCTFCTSPFMWTTAWVARDPTEVVQEMADYREQYDAHDFQFVDLTAILKRDWILAFCDEVIARGWDDVTWQLPSGTRSEAIDEEVADRLVRAGCPILTYAPESGSPALLKRIKKKVKLDRMKESIRGARKAGSKVEIFLMIGFPDETLGEILETYRFILSLAWIGVESVAYSGYRPVPGSEISNGLIEEGRLAYNDEVYLSLMKSTSFFGGVSWNQRYGDFQLSVLRSGGLALFYGTMFLLRPWRFLRLIGHVITRKQSTKLDRVFIDLFDRIRGRDSSKKPDQESALAR